MNCDRLEELLIVFMEGAADSSERESVERHLESCPHCSKKLEDYRRIRALFAEETPPQPSPQVFAALSRTAREELGRDKPSFWKKWFYSPILIPVMSSALALFLWISYGEDNAKIFSDNKDVYSSREVMAKKLPDERKPNLPVVSEEASEDFGSRSGGVLSNEPSSVSRQDPGGRGRIQAAAPAPPFKESFYGSDMEETDEIPETSEYRDEVSAAPESESTDKSLSRQPAGTENEEAIVQPEVQAEMEAQEEKKVVKRERSYSFLKSDYDDQLSLALKQQSEGDCEASIKTGEELLNSSPPPPDSVKEKAYLSLAECYERKEQWEAAILNYRNLEEVAPEQSGYAKEKIEILEGKNALLKTK